MTTNKSNGTVHLTIGGHGHNSFFLMFR